MFSCVRCTRLVTDEECYLLFLDKYCRACIITIENDPDYALVIVQRNALLSRFKQIEN